MSDSILKECDGCHKLVSDYYLISPLESSDRCGYCEEDLTFEDMVYCTKSCANENLGMKIDWNEKTMLMQEEVCKHSQGNINKIKPLQIHHIESSAENNVQHDRRGSVGSDSGSA